MKIPTELVNRNKRLITRIAEGTQAETVRLIPDLSTLGQQEAAGVVRAVTTSTVDRYGAVATVAARQAYTDMRSAVRLVDAFEPELLDYDAAELVGSAVGGSMARWTAGEYAAAALFAGVVASRLVSNIYRDTMSRNSLLDPSAEGFERVAAASACNYCLPAAARAGVLRQDDFAGYHDHCGCSNIPVFRGVDRYRPAYYDQVNEPDYVSALPD